LRRIIAIIVAVAVVAAAGIGIGLASFPRLPPQQNEQIPPSPEASAPVQVDDANPVDNTDSIPVTSTNQELIHNTFQGAGWSEESAKAFSSIKTEFHEGNSTYARYTQTLPSGITNDVRIIATPGEKYVPVEADKLYTQFGTVIYLKDAKSYSGPGFEATKISYFLPYDSLDAGFIEQMGWADPSLQVAGISVPGIQYASATTETTGVGMESTAIRSTESSAAAADMDARIANAEVDVARTRNVENIFREGGELAVEASNDPVIQEINRRLTPEAVELRRQQAAFHDAETRRMVDEIRTRYELADNARVNTKYLIKITAAAGTALAGYELYTIDNQYDMRSAWLNYYEDCVRNPDIPRFNDPRGDPGFDQAIEQIESAREGLRVSSTAMAGASVVNGVAGLVAHNPVVDGLTMAASMAEQALLERAIQDEMSGLSELNSPCRPPPCEETPDEPSPPPPPTPNGDYTPGPDEAGFFMTMGPREWYEPPDRRENQCRLPEPNQLRVIVHVSVDENEGTPRQVTFDTIANVTNLIPIGDSGSMVQVTDFSGNATAFYREIIRYPDATLEGGWCNVEISGEATMNVRIQRDMSGFGANYDLAEVNVGIVGKLPINQTPAGCNGDRTNTEQNGMDGQIFGCSFFDVDERGGRYRDGSGPESLDETNIYYDQCELFMGPLVEFGAT
jgi:hypothetical protein